MEKIIEFVKFSNRYWKSKSTNREVGKFVQSIELPKNSVKQNFWNRNTRWDNYFQRHEFSERSNHYVPYDYYNYAIQPNLNDERYSVFIQDKNLYDKLYGGLGIDLPKTFLRCFNGVFMDSDYNLVDNPEEFCSGIRQNIIIKKTKDSFGGKGIEKYLYANEKLLSISNDQNLNVHGLKDTFGENFIIQEEVRQHSQLSKLHPYSLNSIRVDSYRSVKTNKVHVLMAFVRMGGNKSFVDNVSSGGHAVGLDIDESNEAKLRKYSLVPFSNDKYEAHPDTHIKFEDYQIPGFQLIVKAIETLSNVIPYERLVSWDFSVGENGKPVLIELNKTGGIWVSQEANGAPFFGEFSEEVKEYLSDNRQF